MNGSPEQMAYLMIEEIENELPRVVENLNIDDSTLKRMEWKERSRMSRAKKGYRYTYRNTSARLRS